MSSTRFLPEKINRENEVITENTYLSDVKPFKTSMCTQVKVIPTFADKKGKNKSLLYQSVLFHSLDYQSNTYLQLFIKLEFRIDMLKRYLFDEPSKIVERTE